MDCVYHFKLIAHRNETPGCPENSVESLVYSAQEGIYAVECDVRRTGDGQYVIYHDENTDRLSGVCRNVSDLTLEQLRGILASSGRKVITLAELIDSYHADKPILLHVKERQPHPDMIALFRSAKDLFIFGVESIEVLRAVREFMPAERVLAFMPKMDTYDEFIRHGAGIIRLWEGWLRIVTPDMVHAAGAPQVWIMCSTKEHGMDGCPESLDRFVSLHADGALISDVKMGLEWQAARKKL
jgi:hypothetical protein